VNYDEVSPVGDTIVTKVSTYWVAFHERLKTEGIEPSIQLATKHCGRHIKSAANLALGQTVHELSEIVSKVSPPTWPLSKIFPGYHRKMQEECRDKGRNECCRRAKTCFMNIR